MTPAELMGSLLAELTCGFCKTRSSKGPLHGLEHGGLPRLRYSQPPTGAAVPFGPLSPALKARTTTALERFLAWSVAEACRGERETSVAGPCQLGPNPLTLLSCAIEKICAADPYPSPSTSAARRPEARRAKERIA
jgi:hypothetical protein